MRKKWSTQVKDIKFNADKLVLAVADIKMINRFHIRDPLLLIMTGKESKKNYFGSLCYLFIFAPYSISLSGHLRNPNKLCRQWVLKENFCVPKMVDYSPSYKIFIFQFHFMYIVISQSMRYQDTLKSMCAVFHK